MISDIEQLLFFTIFHKLIIHTYTQLIIIQEKYVKSHVCYKYTANYQALLVLNNPSLDVIFVLISRLFER